MSLVTSDIFYVRPAACRSWPGSALCGLCVRTKPGTVSRCRSCSQQSLNAVSRGLLRDHREAQRQEETGLSHEASFIASVSLWLVCRLLPVVPTRPAGWRRAVPLPLHSSVLWTPKPTGGKTPAASVKQPVDPGIPAGRWCVHRNPSDLGLLYAEVQRAAPL